MVRNQKGFTLIEIIAVLVILGILAAVAVPKYLDMQGSARVKAAYGAIAEVKARYSMAYGKYLLDNNGANPKSASDVLSNEDAIAGIGDFVVTVSGTDSSTVTIGVTSVQGVALTADQTSLITGDTPRRDQWTIPVQ